MNSIINEMSVSLTVKTIHKVKIVLFYFECQILLSLKFYFYCHIKLQLLTMSGLYYLFMIIK